MTKKSQPLGHHQTKSPAPNRSFSFEPAPGLRIRNAKYSGIDIDTAFSELLLREDSFFGHREILFRGVVAWTKRSRNQVAARKAVAKATARHMADAEVQMAQHIWMGLRKDSTKPVPRSIKQKLSALALGQTFASADERYQQLYRNIYLPIGGMAAIVDAYNAPAKSKTTKNKKKRPILKPAIGIRNLVAVATVLDFHARELRDDFAEYGRPNLLKAGPLGGLLAKSGNKMFSNSYINELVADHRNAFALLYAADRVNVADGFSLLDKLLSKKPKHDEIVPYLSNWLSFAKYFHDSVLSKMKGYWKKTYCPNIAGIESHQPTLRDLTDKQIEKMKNHLRAKTSSARLQLK